MHKSTWSRERAGYIFPKSIITQRPTGCQEVSQYLFLKNFHALIDNFEMLYIIYSMKNEKTRPTKKALVKILEDKGVDKSIVASLQRANIDTLVWVISKIS